MKRSFGLLLLASAIAALLAIPFISAPRAKAGQLPFNGYKALSPITHGNLAIFPVVAATTHDTRSFLTLDEGLRSGEVVVTEAGQITPLVRRRPGYPVPQRGGGAEVNRLVLVNNSDRPLILLAGEIVTGGKQDRVIGKDRIVPSHSDPLDLSVFCVEPGRWTATSAKFDSLGVQMAQPSVRRRAMASRDQQQVWAEVNKSASAMAEAVPEAAARDLRGMSSYARVMSNDEVKRQVDAVAAPVARSYESVIRRLREQNAVGVVVAVNGQIVWADLFAGPSLLEKYWPKLVRSYAAEALTARAKLASASVRDAQEFLDNFDSTRQMVETEPGVFRHTEIVGSGFHAFQLTSLLPKTGFDIHFSKMAE
jgi:hypothetical protein